MTLSINYIHIGIRFELVLPKTNKNNHVLIKKWRIKLCYQYLELKIYRVYLMSF